MEKNQQLDWTNLEPSDPSELGDEDVEMGFLFTRLAYWRYEKFQYKHSHNWTSHGVSITFSDVTLDFGHCGLILCKCPICGVEANITDYNAPAPDAF